jgi:hypothetical protein
MSTVPIFAPDGTLGDVPYERMHDAIAAGGKPGVTIKSPDGSLGVIPADRTQDAVKAGGSIVPIQDQETQHAGFWHKAWSDIASIPEALAAPDPLADPRVSDQDKWQIAQQQNKDALAKNAQRVQEHGHLYDLGATANEMMGVNVAGEEQSAKEGDKGGVLGHAAAVPMVMAATELAMRGIKAIAPKPETLYQSALKPSTRIPAPKIDQIVQTGLEQGVPVSHTGIEKLTDLVDDLNDKIKAEIQAQPDRPVSSGKVLQRLNPVVDKFSTQVNPAADLNSIYESGKEFAESQPGDIPAAQAQALKQGTYQQLKGRSYGELKSATIESQKALARGLKEELNNAFPELANLNASESKLLNLQPVLEKAVQRVGNHNLIGISGPIAAGATEALTGSPGIATSAGILKTILDNPNVKSNLAIALYRAARNPGELSTVSQRLDAYYAALANAANGQQNADHKNQPAN